MRISLIVAAGGNGVRFRRSLEGSAPRSKRGAPRGVPGPLSKIFSLLGGKPLVAHALAGFRRIPAIRETVVAVPHSHLARLQGLARRFGWKDIRCVPGGRTRAESVWRALGETDPKNPWILVHDGARPFVSPKSVGKLLRAVRNAEGAVLARKVFPTLKEVDASRRVKRTVDRTFLYEAQTPQIASRKWIARAYRENPRALEATDEASLLESVGARVKVVEHEAWNPKITTFEDLRLAEAYLASGRREILRTGFGRDAHRLVRGRRFYLGGIRIPFSKGPLGHSDGDTLLHAVTDAILGATGKGDIGEWFSDRNPRYQNVRSGKLVAKVLRETARDGWRVEHVDTVISLERPKLGPYKKAMRKALGALLGVAPDAVSIKAKTMEGLGPIGKGEAVVCEALVAMRKVVS